MTMKQPRIPGPYLRPGMQDKEPPECRIAIQALCHGPLDWRVQGVPGAAARQGRAHIALRYGRVLLYLEDRAALGSLVEAVQAAFDLRDKLFEPEEDAFTEAERRERRLFERQAARP